MPELPEELDEMEEPAAQEAPATPQRAFPRDTLLVAAAALLGRLPALGAFWNRDDWVLLARASGLRESEGFPARVVSQVLYWKLLHPLFGLATDPWAWTRLLLHVGAAVLVRRIARRCGLSAPAALLAALLFAATPLAFAPLYWAAGVQELLGATLALLAIDRLLAGGRAALWVGLCAGVLAIFAKENALCLPLFAAILAWGAPERRRTWLLAAGVLAVAAAGEIMILWRAFPHGPGTSYELAPLSALPMNLVSCGWWLATPWPFFAPDDNLLALTAGLLAWSLWLGWSWRRWRGGDRRPAAWLAAALLSVAPALVVDFRLEPRLAYLAFAPLALLLGGLVLGGRERLRTLLAVGLAVVTAAVGWTVFEVRLSDRDETDLPRDPLVLHTAVSHEALRVLDALGVGSSQRIVILQVDDTVRRRDRLSVPGHLPLPTLIHASLAGDLGHALHGSPAQRIDWVRSLDKVPLDALVLADAGPRLRFWGPVAQAFIYQTLTEIAHGRHDAAVVHLRQGMRNSRPAMAFVFDATQLPASPEDLRRNANDFLNRIKGTAGLAPAERDALLETARELLTRCNAYI